MFDGALAIGLIFLLPEDRQLQLINRLSRALLPGARLLFTAPRRACEWTDSLIRRRSSSLGETLYRQALKSSGMDLVGTHSDEGDNYYYDAVRTSVALKPASPKGS